MGSLRTEILSRPSSVPAPRSPSPPLVIPPSNDDIEAIIQLATSARPSPDGRTGPPRDTRTQLFVGNLPYRVRWQDLKDLFRKAGTVLRADVSLGPDNRSRGYGTVLLATAEDAGRAVDMFNGYSWQTRILEVRPDRLPPDFDSAPASISATTFNTPNPTMAVTGVAEDYEYAALFGPHERPGSAGSGGCGGRNLFVGNLPFHCQWQDLKDLFRQAGTIIRADVALGQDGRSRGFGTVVFATEFDAERAVKMFNGYEYNGRPLKVHYDKFSQSQPATTPASPSLQASFAQQPPPPPSFSSSLSGTHPTHIALPRGYAFDYGPPSGPNSPFDTFPPQVSHTHNHHVSAALANLGAPPSPGARSPSPHPHPHLRQQSQHHGQHHPAHPGPISLPPLPSVSGFPIPAPHTLSPHALSPLHHPLSMGSPLHHPARPQQLPHPHIIPMTPHGLPPITPSMPPFTFLPQPSPHNPAPPTPTFAAPMSTPPLHTAAHMLSAFSPGVAMSPGAFWGRPGGGAANPFMNPAVGAPVHGMYGYAQSPPASRADEPGGYFDGGYFPPVSALGASRLANEILRDGSAAERYAMDSSPSEATDVGTGGEGEGERRQSSSTATSWHTPDELEEGVDGAEQKEKERDENRATFEDDEAEAGGNDTQGSHRAYSMSTTAGRPAGMPGLPRTGSDPVQAHPRAGQELELGPSSTGHDSHERERRPVLSPAGEMTVRMGGLALGVECAQT